MFRNSGPEGCHKKAHEHKGHEKIGKVSKELVARGRQAEFHKRLLSNPETRRFQALWQGSTHCCNPKKPCYHEAGSTTEQWVRNTVESSFGSALPRQHGCPPPFGPAVFPSRFSPLSTPIRAGDAESSGPCAVFGFPNPDPPPSQRNAHAQY